MDSTHDRMVTIQVDTVPVVNYAIQQNRFSIVNSITITNNGETPLTTIAVEIRSEPEFCLVYSQTIDSISPSRTHVLEDVALDLSPTYLEKVPEKVSGLLHCHVKSMEGAVASTVVPVDILSYDQWPGSRYFPELLAAFVLPNHPAVGTIARAAASALQKHTGDGALSGYQSRSRERVLATAGSVFCALWERDIAYCGPPANFESEGQKIRLPDRILSERLGTCLDLACLSAAVLEQAGLHPLLLLTGNHAFVGLWLIEDTFPEPVGEDGLRVSKRVELGEILVFDPTRATDRRSTFRDAVTAAKAHLSHSEDIHFVIDVKTCRSQVTPLPIGIAATVEDKSQTSGTEDSGDNVFVLTDLPPLVHDELSRPATEPGASERSRIDNWKRSLLDLSKNNRLLNFKDTKKNVPLLCHNLAELEDSLADGEEFWLYSHAADELSEKGRKQTGLVAHGITKAFADALRNDFLNKRLRLKVSENECGKRLLAIFREARTALQDNGANLLYLAIGFLYWKESDTSDVVRRAPLLMLPLELRRKNGTDMYSILQADDEPRINTSLLEMLRREYNIEVSGIDPLPLDAHGLDIPRILNCFRMAVRDMQGWHVEEEAAIGLFSFTKFLMWRDLNERSELLEEQEVLASLLTGGVYDDFDGSGYPQAEELDAKFDPKDVFCPLSMDSSQMAAVLAAASGKSFILNGPPGTGKSQTIANMIAHCLTIGKTVLFVAEKAAALDVVHKRLKDIGLGNYCLELHSRKAQKKQVMQQLGSAWNAPRHVPARNWAAASANLAMVRERLNRYSHSLHKERPLGKSLFWGLSKSIGYQKDDLSWSPVKLPWRSAEIARMSGDEYDRLCAVAQQLCEVAMPIGLPGCHPWRNVKMMQWKGSTPRVLRELLDAAIDALPEYLAAQRNAQNLFPVHLAASLEELVPVADELAEALEQSPGRSVALLLDDPNDIRIFLDELATRLHKNSELAERLFAKYHESLLDENLALMAEQYTEVMGMGSVKQFFAANKLRKQLLTHCLLKKKKPPLEEIREDIIAALEYKTAQGWFKENEERLASLLGNSFRHDSMKDFTQASLAVIRQWKKRIRTLLDGLSHFAGENGEVLRQYIAHLTHDCSRAREEGERIQTLTTQWKKAGASWFASKKELSELLQPDSDWFAELERSTSDALLEQLKLWRDSLSSLQEWSLWLCERERACQEGLGPMVECFEQGKVDGENIPALFDASFCYWWTEGIADADADICSYSLAKLRSDLANFKKLDGAHTELAKEEIRHRLVARAATAKAGSDNHQRTVLQKQMALQRGHLSIRKLMDTAGGLIRGIMPCFLMSPISVAQYLAMDTQKFDLVIFDEASQIPTWDAAGVMARGNQIIIAGDPNQLPPTNFFQRQANSDEDPEDIEYQDLESVLDDFLTANVREVYLKWHYRSRNENLIAFSNHHYYDNRLLTFPSADRGKGVSLRHVSGVYDRAKSRTNPVEAQAVVAEIMERLNDPARGHQSIGVVTFNQAQQVLIEDLLDAARKGRRDLDRRFDPDNADAVMVKNLENVQGDERDVMLLSICYGPDDAGKVGFNFGPLNRNGGERRLNVAITRAKYETVVFSSLHPEQIDLSRTRALGVKHLRNYIEYARSGPAALAALVGVDPVDDFDSPFEKQVAEFLRHSGFDVVSQVGCSGYRIDLGVVGSDDKGHFILGIECDGKNYHSAKTARDRDRLREAVLEGLGWRLHRIWSTDWFYNRQSAQQKLLVAVNEAEVRWRNVRHAPKSPPSTLAEAEDSEQKILDFQDVDPVEVIACGIPIDNVAHSDEPQEKSIITVMSNATEGIDTDATQPSNASHIGLDTLPEYTPAVFSGNLKKSAPFFSKESDAQIRNLLRKVIEAESPIAVDAALLRVAGFWGQNALTSAVRERMKPAMRGWLQKRHQGKAFFWKNDKALDAYREIRRNGTGRDSRRASDEIPPEEYANAIEWLAHNNGPLTRVEALRLVADVFHLEQSEMVNCAMLEIGLELLVNQRRVSVDSEGIIVVNDLY